MPSDTSLYKQILQDLNLPLVLWTTQNNTLTCTYHKLVENVNINDTVDTYKKTFKEGHQDSFDKLVSTGDEQKINCSEVVIILSKITDDIYLEIHYPRSEDLFIMYSISSKLRNPLTNIMGLISVLEDKIAPQDRRYLSLMKNSCYDIVSLANDVVDMVNLKTAKIELKQDKTTVDKIVEDSYKVVANDLRKKGLRFNKKISDDLPDMITVDVSRLLQIVVNIISNALKHTTDGAISLEVSLFDTNGPHEFPFLHRYQEIKDKYTILFAVKDTGSGIDTDYRKVVDKVLDIHHADDIKSYKNVGLGLMLCRDLTALMGGHIWYKSQVDMGSVFYFTITCDGIKLN